MFLSDAIMQRIQDIVQNSKKIKSISNWCNKAGMSPNNLYDIRKRKTGYPSIPTLKKLCDAIGMTLPEFFSVDYILSAECEDDFVE